VISVDSILTPAAADFVDSAARRFRGDLSCLLAARRALQRDPRGHFAAVAAEPPAVLEPNWRVPLPHRRLLDRRVEITGPAADPRMALKALRSGASGYMVDGEDSLCPTWDAVLRTQSTLTGISRGTLARTLGAAELGDWAPTLHYRPRGLHLEEVHWLVDGSPAPAPLVDAGLFLWWNAAELLARGEPVALYLPKLESEAEAAWWDGVLEWCEVRLGLPVGTVRVTVLVETLPALLRLESIADALRRRLAGLNVGRWDYIFSAVKVLSRSEEGSHLTLPDRGELTMDSPPLAEYARWVVRVAHSRGAHAVGGMAAQVPSRRDPVAAEAAVAAVRRDKDREWALGHDGTWVAHPDLVPVAMASWEAALGDRLEQLGVLPGAPHLHLPTVVAQPPGRLTEAGVRGAARTALRYWAAWLEGNGCVALDGRMEDAATAEISGVLLWHWLARGATTAEGRKITADWVSWVVRDETEALAASGGTTRVGEAADLLLRAVITAEPTEFVLAEAYRRSFVPCL